MSQLPSAVIGGDDIELATLDDQLSCRDTAEELAIDDEETGTDHTAHCR
jgi:hypothetical protein